MELPDFSRQTHFFRKLSIAIAFFSLLWATLVHLRPIVIQTDCTQFGTSARCAKNSLWSFDQISIGAKNSMAEKISFFNQGLVGVIFLILVFVFASGRKMFSQLFFGLEVSLINGALTESIRLLVQRPRPFVLDDPATHGQNAANYVSFVSGHTSFVSAMAFTIAFLFLRRPGPVAKGLVSLALFLVPLTAVCRVAAGRHYISDVFGGILVGALALVLGITFRLTLGESAEKTERVCKMERKLS